MASEDSFVDTLVEYLYTQPEASASGADAVNTAARASEAQ